jgi:autotransporter-associated beta strand protein
MKTGLTVAILCIAASQHSFEAGASVYNVTNSKASGAGSLSQALSQAQTDTNAVINIGPGLGTITLNGALPAVQNNLVVNGNSNIISGANSNRIFFVNAPGKTVQINGLILSDGFAQGGNGGLGYGGGGGGAGLGGAIFLNAGNLSVSNISFLNNSARGGAGSAGFNAGLNPTLGGGGGGGGLSFNGGNGGGSVNNKTYEGPAGGGGALTSVGQTVNGGTAFGSTGGGANGGIGGSAGLNASAGNGVSPSLADGGGGGGGMSTGPGTGGTGGNGSDFGGGGGAGSSSNGNSGKSGNGGFGGGGGGDAFSRGGIAFAGGTGGFGGGGGGGGKSLISTNSTNFSYALGGSGGFGGGFGSSGTNGNGGGGLGAGGAIFARAGSLLTIQDSSFTGDAVTGGNATSPATNGSAIGQALFLGGNLNYFVSSGTNNLLETIGGGNDPNAQGGLTKSGAGALALSGGLSYVGNTTVSAGTLVVSNRTLVSPVITINSNAVLAYSYSNHVLQPGTTFTGSGTLRFNGTGNPVFGTNAVNVNFSPGALIDIQSGKLTGSTNHGGLWTANQASLNIAAGAVFDAEEAGTSGTMQIDGLTGQGTFQGGFINNPNGGLSTVTIGAAGGSGNFSGTLQDGSRGRLGIVKAGSGTNIFSGTNSYSGSTAVSGGTLVVSNTVLHSPAITIASGAVLEFSEANQVFLPGTMFTGAGTLRFVGTGNPSFSGGIGVGFSPGALIDIQSGELTGSYNRGGDWTSNQASLNITNGAVFDAMDAGPTGTMQIDALTGSGTFQGGASGLATITIGVANGSGTFSGIIKDNVSASLGIVKTGSGTEIFTAANTYSGNTIVNGGTLVVNGTAGSGIVLVNSGTLAGTGTISGAVSIGTSATLAPGAPTGAMTMLNTLTLAGNTLVTLNSGAASKIVGLAGIDYSGTLTVTNIGGPLSAGSSFTLFSARSSAGNFSNVTGNPGEGLGLRFNPTNGVLSVVSTILPTTPTNLAFKATAGSLTVNWPASYTGWILQAQTNPLWLGMTSSNWLDVTGSGSTDSMSFAISPTNNVFFRMRLP